MANLTYVTVGTNQLEKALTFYDQLLAGTGFKTIFEHPRGGRLYGNGTVMFGILKPFNGEAATIGNGSMFGFSCNTFEEVDALFNKAIELGGSDDGAPGERSPGMYFSYFRDLDGNKLCAYCMKQ